MTLSPPLAFSSNGPSADAGRRLSIAVIGSGVSVTTRLPGRWAPVHDVTLYEKDHRPGAIRRPWDIDYDGTPISVDNRVHRLQ